MKPKVNANSVCIGLTVAVRRNLHISGRSGPTLCANTVFFEIGVAVRPNLQISRRSGPKLEANHVNIGFAATGKTNL